MRSDAAKQARNRSVKTTLKTTERRLNDAIKDGNKESTQAALNAASSAFDKAAKLGVIHCAKADRKKSRLAVRANAAA
jgi:small subunit ribosomal protein S20